MLSYVILIALSLAIFAFVLRPLFEARRRYSAPPAGHLNDLLARRRYLLEALRDVDLDYSTGKAEEDEYRETRRSYLREAALIQREIEQHTEHLDSDLDREIAELRDLARRQAETTGQP
jgi:hypothetical protein